MSSRAPAGHGAMFLIIVAQFNSISYPVIVMSTVVFSTIGVFLGLIVFRMDFIILMTMLSDLWIAARERRPLA